MFGWLRRAPPPPSKEQHQVMQALAGYTPYAPPEWKPDSSPESMRAASFQYRDYFLDSKQARLETLRAFLTNFDVSPDLDDAGLMAVSTWLPHWADLLVDDLVDQATRDTYQRFTSPWTGKLSGLNAKFDLGIYHAECLWSHARNWNGSWSAAPIWLATLSRAFLAENCTILFVLCIRNVCKFVGQRSQCKSDCLTPTTPGY